MNNKEIRQAAAQRIAKNSGNCISLTAFMFAVFVFLGLCELTLWLIFKQLGWGYVFTFAGLKKYASVKIFWIINAMLVLPFAAFEMWTVRRLFVDISRNENYVATRQYINAHSFTYYRKTIFASLIINSLKFFSAVPLIICIHGVYYWGYICKLSELTSMGLLCFMFSLGLSLVMLGLTVHYWISLALAPYIMTLNPRTNVFDACDLSVRLMDGQHGRYIYFMLSFAKFIPAMLFIYPFFGIYPFYRMCYIVLMEDILGDYWQDKMPGMIKRWRKYSV